MLGTVVTCICTHWLTVYTELRLMTLGWVGMPGAIWMCFLLQLRLAHSTKDSQCCGYMHVPEGMTLLGCWHYQSNLCLN